MRTRSVKNLSLLVLTIAALGGIRAAEANKLLSVSAQPQAGGSVVTIATAETPVFTAFRLYDPMRVVVDVSEGDTGKFIAPVTINNGVVGDVAFRQFRAGSRSIGRITVEVLKNMRYEVRSNGKNIEVHLFDDGRGAIKEAALPPAPPALDRKALDEAKAAQKEAVEAVAAAQREQKEAKELKESLKQKDRELAIKENKLQAEHEALKAAEKEYNELKNQLDTAAKAERKALEAEINKSARQKEAAEQAYAKSLIDKAQLKDEISALKREKLKSEKAAETAALLAEEKLTKAEQALNKASSEKEALSKKLSKAEAELAKAEEQKNIAEEERARLKERKQELDKQRAEVARQLAEQRELAAAQTKERLALEKSIASFKEENSRLTNSLAESEKRNRHLEAEHKELLASQKSLEEEKAALSNEVALLKQNLAAKNEMTAASYGPAQVERVAQRKNGDIVLSFAGKLPRYESQMLYNPPRVVLDLEATARKATLPLNHQLSGQIVSRIRLGEHPGKLRVVLDLRQDKKNFQIKEEGRDIVISFTNSMPSYMRAADNPAAAGAALDVASRGRISKVSFNKSEGYSTIAITLDSKLAYTVDESPDKAYVLTISGAIIDADAERALDTTSFHGAVEMVSAYQESRNPPVVKVLVNMSEKSPYTLNYQGGRLVWEIADALSAPARGGLKMATPGAAGSFRAPSGALASTLTAAPASQKRITIDLKDADVVNVIRLIAEVSGENIITSDAVGGKITLKLRNVPWEQALDIILATKGYGKVRINNIIRIAPTQDLQKEKEMELSRRKAEQLVTDPVKKVVLINYAKAGELKNQLTPLLSERGSIQESERKNALIINELPDKIDEILELTKALDTPTPQVRIEARIVEASSNYLRQLGIQWGGRSTRSPVYGNATGLSFPNTMIFSGAADDETANQTGGVLTPSNYAVNLPAAIGSGSGGGIGISFGNVSGSAMLSLRISALEESGAARIISTPSVTTLDNKKAHIEQGIDIPISVVSAAGVNTRFVSASLELEVEPHITNDGSVMMQLKVTKSEPDFSRTGASGDPTIQKKSAETEVLVPDGDTTVVGGILTINTSKTTSKVPFLSKIPILGYLFRSTREEDNRAELLIFVTPRIVNRDTALNSSAELTFDSKKNMEN